MKLLPDSIRTRIVLVLLVGLTVTHLASISLYYAAAGYDWPLRPIASTLVMIAGIVIFTRWAAGWIIAPLAAFAVAAERLGRDVASPAMAEDGAREVRVVVRAFNRMQERIRNFVEDRLRMLAAISHDLRSPITRLRLRVEQMPMPDEQRQKMLADLAEMEQMVTSSLHFARDEAETEASHAFDLAALLTTLCDDAADAGQQADFIWEGRLVFDGRPLATKRLFLNLIDNALRYGRRAEVRLAVTPHVVIVTVDDDGPGIPTDRAEDVFKPFFRLEGSRNKRTGGIGLGLATARTIARAHGGDITLTNRPEGGLRATVTLPRGPVDGDAVKPAFSAPR